MKNEIMETEMITCPIYRTLAVIQGKWKPLIIYELMNGSQRFNQLRRLLPGITQRMLTSQLRELERDAIVNRTVFEQVPPHVEYSLTEKGKALWPMFTAMQKWAEENLEPVVLMPEE